MGSEINATKNNLRNIASSRHELQIEPPESDPIEGSRAHFPRRNWSRDQYTSLKAAAALPDFWLAMLGGLNASVVEPGRSHHFNRHSVVEAFHHFKDSRMIVLNGSARDVVTDEMRKWLPTLARPLVAAGVGLSSGGSRTGVMGLGIEVWQEAISRHERQGGTCDARIASILLNLRGKLGSYELPMDVGLYGRVVCKARAFPERTPSMQGVANVVSLFYLEGGIGTAYEAYSPGANRQIRHRGPFGPFDHKLNAPLSIFASGTVAGGGTFWDPTAQQFNEIVQCKLGSADHYTPAVFAVDTDKGRQDCLRMALGLAQGERDARADTKVMTKEERQAHVQVFMRLHEAGFGVVPHSGPEPSFAEQVDTRLAVQRMLYYRREFMGLWKAGYKDTAEQYLCAVERRAETERAEFLGTLKRLQDRPAIYLIGSAKLGSEEGFHDRRLEVYSRELIKGAIERGFSIVIDGKGTEGMPARWSAIWAEEMARFARENGRLSPSELVRVQLAYGEEEMPARTFPHGIRETVLPSALTFEVRTACAGLIGGSRAVVLAPGGPELAAWHGLLQERQMAGSVDGCYDSMADRPIFSVLNVPGRLGGAPFFDNLKRQFEVMESGGTISSGDYSPEWFDTLERPARSAKDIISALSKSRM